MGRLLVLFVTAFVDMIGLVMVLPLLPYYAKGMGAGAATVGILVSAFSVAQLASAPVWGRLSDRRGRRPAILLGLTITAVAYLLFGLADSIAVLLISRVVQGLGGGTIGVIQAYVADVSDDTDRTKALGWLSAVTSFGAVTGPAFGSLMVSMAGPAAPGFAAAGLSLLVACFAWRFLDEPHRVRSATKERRVSSFKAVMTVATRLHRPAPRLIWTYAIGIGAFYGTVPIMPLLLEARLGITEHSIGYVIMYLGGMGLIVRTLFLGRVVDALGEVKMSRLGIALLAAGLALMAVADGYLILLLSLTLMPLGTAFLFPALTARLSKMASTVDRGLYLGVQHTFGGMARVGFPVVVGFMMDQIGLGLPMLLAAGLVLATLPLTWPPRRRAAQAADEPALVTMGSG